MIKIKRLFQITALLLALSAVPRVSAGEETVYVFYPSAIRPVLMQQKMTESCPGIQIKVYGRFTDFEAQVLADKPDAILTKYPVIQQIGGYSITLKGSRKGQAEESSILVSVDEKIDLNSIPSISVGMFDILGREGMKKMTDAYFSQPPRLRLVSKIEDLLQLLTLNMVKAILIPENQFAYFKELSHLNFAITQVPNARTGIIALAVRDGGSAGQVIKALTGTDSKSTEMLEVDKWEQ